MSAAHAILERLSALGAQVECRGERVVLRAGACPVPAELIEAAREVKSELTEVLRAAEGAQQREAEHLRSIEPENPRISTASVEGAQLAGNEHLGVKVPTEDAQLSAFDKPKHFRRCQLDPEAKALNARRLSTFGQEEHLWPSWGEAEQERAAIIEHDGAIPRKWAEGFARLDPDRSRGDVPLFRWQRFINDVGLFLDSPFCAVAAAFGWGPHDLFGCNRDRPFARIDKAGLLWLLNGDRIAMLADDTATITKQNGTRLTYHRKPTEPGQVLAWELAR